MRNYLLALTTICVALIRSHAAEADPAGTAFCSRLIAQMKTPIANKIYFSGRDGTIVQLQSNAEIPRGQTDLYFYRYRSNEATDQAGAVAVKIVYFKASSLPEAQVTLFNSNKTVQQRCKVTKVERYERFHGESEEPNSCIRTSFHQGYRRGDPPFNTLDPVARRREFILGVSGEDTRGFGEVIWQVAQSPFEYTSVKKLFTDSSSSGAPQSTAVSYRSQIYNYSGQSPTGSCIRFSLLSDIDDVSANIGVSDLLESQQGEFVRAGVKSVRFVGN
jgi:hypothetical protein